MELIAVILGAKDSTDRFASASALLDWGFTNFKLVTVTYQDELPSVTVNLGADDHVSVNSTAVSLLIRSSDESLLTTQILLPESVNAPVSEGERIGTLLVRVGDAVAAAEPLTVNEGVDRLTISAVFTQFMRALVCGTENRLIR